MIYLTSENYAKFYNAKPFSFASILCLIIALATVVIPALLAFTTSGTPKPCYQLLILDAGVGLRQTVYTEQPIITFRDELIIYNFQGSEVLGYSSSTTFNNGLGTSLITSPVIKVFRAILFSTF